MPHHDTDKEKARICLDCDLPNLCCNDRSKDTPCYFIQITRANSGNYKSAVQKRARTRKRKLADEKLKADIIAILGNLIGEKAIDEAKAGAR